ncbi:beta strand repeat-containing protein [Larkinella rosea]|uniref:Uncharacterized protein n=1 Tax=Larkinella rosea TaxID=2025312 RepID=A0A3P1BML3_9BACT|nr:hypothetical protein [Larkinella rosea]RRB02026.1 hypothetical protein EHT25_16150 [Larkinella rosea]
MASFYCLKERINHILIQRLRHQFVGLLAIFFVLAQVLPAYSQACYTPISGTAVGGVSGNGPTATVCLGQSCLQSANYNELQKITDSSLETYANLSSLVNVSIFNDGLTVKKSSGTYPSGTITGFVLGGNGVVDLSLLSGVKMVLYNAGVPQSQTISVGSSLATGTVLGTSEKLYATFTAANAFDEIRLVTTGVNAAALSTLRIYAAVAFAADCSTPQSSTVCDDFIDGSGTDVTYTQSSVCVGCSLTDRANLIDADKSDYAILTPTATVGSAVAVGVIDTKRVYSSNGRRVGFVISRTTANALLAANVFNTITIETYLFGTLQESKNVTSGTNALNLALLSGTTDVAKLKLGFATTTGKDFNEVRIRINPVLNASIGAIRLYGAFVEPTSCTNCEKALNDGNATNTPYSVSIVSGASNTGLYGLAVFPSLSGVGSLTTASTSDFVDYYTGTSVAGGVRLTVKNNGTDFAGQTFVGFHIASETGLIDVGLLDGITIRVYKDGNSTPVATSTTANLLGASLLGGTSRSVVGFVPNAAFDQVQIDISAVLNLLGHYYVYDVFVIEDGDGDGVPDCQDTCSGTTDTDGDGILDSCDQDDDNDGITDVVEYGTADASLDTDGDGIPDIRDLDSDNDGIPDVIEGGGTDADLDGKADGGVDITTGIPSSAGTGLTPPDTDGDTRKDFQDLDSDNDGINDVLEASGTDSDGNGMADGTVSATTGIPATAGTGGLTPPNTDGTDNPDYRDLDSDNDGIPDLYESGLSNPGTLDGATKDGKIEDADGADKDGIPQNVDGATGTFGDANSPTLANTDSDSNPNFRDLDSDNDGILDSVERGSDGTNPTNSDGGTDGKPDYIDLDSDNDGINDVVEGNGTDANGDGIADGTPGSTGIPATAGSGLTPPDTDNDSKKDFQDVDSDGDGIFDLYESGVSNPASLDTNKDGIIDDASETDNDGIPTATDGATGTYGDANSPALPNNDSSTGDTVPNYRDLDSDNDSIPDSVEKGSDGTNPTNTDGDNLPDYLDLDSDNDGINDVIEATGNTNNDTNGDGIADGAPNSNGIPGSVSATNGITTPNDADNDGTPNYRDLDSDNDGIKDLYESGISNPGSLDTNGDGVVDAADGADNDGIPQTVDGAPATYGDSGNPTLPDNDTDNTPDFVDPAVDLTPTHLMPNAGFTAIGQSRNLTITVKNIPAGSKSSGTITLTVTKPTQYMTVAFSGSAGDDWTLTDSGSFFKLVSKAGVTIDGGAANAKTIGLTLTLSTGANSGASVINTRIQTGSGGEINNENNTTITSVNITL